MLEIEIDGKALTVNDGCMVMDAATQAGIYIPHFCYHKKLSIAANCRMCLVSVEKAPKPLPACATPVTDGMKVSTHSESAVKAQQGVMEFLLINHPLDCPICDQGGECQLQDLAVGYGMSNSRYTEDKRVVADKYLGPLIATDLTRCIHCTRCVRFGQEVAGQMELGMTHRGEHSEIMPFIEKTVDSEVSGNMIDLCPVGALTSKPFRFTARTWELSRRKSISPHDGLGSNLIIQVKQNRVMRVLPFENEHINECWLSDRDRFSYEALNSAQRMTSPQIKQNGVWHPASWSQALDYIARGLQDIRQTQGADAIAGLISPHSTTEELFLFQKLLRDFGSPHVDHRVRQVDFSADASLPGAPWLGQRIADIAHADAMFLLGTNLRKEQPLLATRMRLAAKRGARLLSLSPVDSDFLVPLHTKWIVSPQQIHHALAALVQSLATQTNTPLDATLAAAISHIAANAQSDALAAQLCTGVKRVILVGDFIQHHPQAMQLRVLANAVAQLSNATLGVLGAAANSVGAYLAGAVPMYGPHRAAVAQPGLPASTLLTQNKAAYLLFNLEPELDSWHGAQALQSLKAARMVVYCAPFQSAAALDYADVWLPIAPFSETPGSFVNMEGRLQTFNAVVKPLGEARPGWKVLRVLANVLDLDGYDYTDILGVREALGLQEDVMAQLDNHIAVTAQRPAEAMAETIRIGEVPIYHGDMLSRRAPSLQQTVDAATPCVLAQAAVLAQFGVQDGDLVRVTQRGNAIELVARASTAIADHCISVAASHPKTAMLGGWFDPIQLERVGS